MQGEDLSVQRQGTATCKDNLHDRLKQDYYCKEWETIKPKVGSTPITYFSIAIKKSGMQSINAIWYESSVGKERQTPACLSFF